MNYELISLLFFIICFFGFYLAYLYGRNTRMFRWSEYCAIIILPILCVIFLAFYINIQILNLFVISAFLGFCLEFIIGLTYHKTLNKRLWKYKKFSIKGYTSLLSLPLWGIAGVLFWLMSKLLNL